MINLLYPSCSTTSFLIADVVNSKNGSVDSIPSITKDINGNPVSAALEIQSTLGALLVPRMTTAQINALNAIDGMIAYDTSTQDFGIHQNNNWNSIGNVSGPDVSVAGNIATFSNNFGDLLEDSGVNISDVTPPLSILEKINSKRISDLSPLTNVLQIGNLGAIQFTGGVGLISVYDSVSGSLYPITFYEQSGLVSTIFTGSEPAINPSSVSALLELNSTAGALVISRMSTTQRTNLDAVNGMIVFDNTIGAYYAYQNGWVPFDTAGGSVTQVNSGTGITCSPNPITGVGTVSLETLSPSPEGTYSFPINMTVNAQGQITAIASDGFDIPYSSLAIGFNALAVSTGVGNTAVGYTSMESNTTGNDNSAFGVGSLSANTAGSSNCAFGISTLLQNTIGNNNSAFGYGSLALNIAASNNSAFGVGSLGENTTGNDNSAFGVNNSLANTDGSNNCAFGNYSFTHNTTGSGNCAFGLNALTISATGSGNSAFGFNSADSYQFYTNCTFFGHDADALSENLINACAIGYSAGVGSNDAISLGSNAYVGIGVNSPAYTLDLGNITPANLSVNTQCGIQIAPSSNVPTTPTATNSIVIFNNAGVPSYKNTSGTVIPFLNGTVTQYDVLVGGASNSITSIGSGTTGQVFQSGGSSANPSYTSTLSSLVQGNITSVGTIASGTWNGTVIGINHGGTGVVSVTTAPTASSFSGWDSNKNFSSNNFISGYSTTVTASSTTTLTVGSAYQQFFTGTATQTVVMPATSSLVLGQSWLIVNNSTGILTIQSSGGNTIVSMSGNSQAVITCILTSGTTAASWNYEYSYYSEGVTSIIGTANQVIASSSTGAVTLSLPQSIGTTNSPTFSSLTLTNPLTLSNGGTGSSLTASNGGLIYSTSSALEILATANNGIVATNNSGIPSVQSFFVDGGNSTGNLFLGTSCGAISLTSVQNTGFGVQCLHNITSNANDNTGFGSSALKFMTNGSGNAAFGANALESAAGTSSSNTACGSSAGGSQSTYTNCTFLGNSADASVNNLTNACAIGYNSSVGGSNAIVLGSSANVGIGNTAPTYALQLGSTGVTPLFYVASSSVPSAPSVANDGIYSVSSGKAKFTSGTTQYSGTLVTSITTGAAATAGQATLNGTTGVTISTTAIATTSIVFVTRDTGTGAPTVADLGYLTVGSISAGTSFKIYSSNTLDAVTVNWLIINP